MTDGAAPPGRGRGRAPGTPGLGPRPVAVGLQPTPCPRGDGLPLKTPGASLRGPQPQKEIRKAGSRRLAQRLPVALITTVIPSVT